MTLKLLEYDFPHTIRRDIDSIDRLSIPICTTQTIRQNLQYLPIYCDLDQSSYSLRFNSSYSLGKMAMTYGQRDKPNLRGIRFLPFSDVTLKITFHQGGIRPVPNKFKLQTTKTGHTGPFNQTRPLINRRELDPVRNAFPVQMRAWAQRRLQRQRWPPHVGIAPGIPVMT